MERKACAMAFQKKVPTYRYMTDADRERLARVDHDPRNDYKNFKYMLVLGKKGLSQEVCITIHGKTEEEAKSNIESQLKFYKNADKDWTILRIEDLKNKDNFD